MGAMAMGYSFTDFRSFVGSLRKSGFSGRIILGVTSPMAPKVEDYLAHQSVTAKILTFVNCTFDPNGTAWSDASDSHVRERFTCAAPYAGMKVRWSRFALLRDWLLQCEECTGSVLVCDFRDTFFQLDPFGEGSPLVQGLQVFREHRTQTTAHWIVRAALMKCKSMDFGAEPRLQPMLCSGTTVGTRSAMLAYLDAMYQEMSEWLKDEMCCCNGNNGDDQAIHNYLFYTGRLKHTNAVAVPNRAGIVNTAGVLGSMILEGQAAFLKEVAGYERPEAMRAWLPGSKGQDEWIGQQFDVTDEKGYFVNFDGSRSRVVHQYDRFGFPFSSWQLEKKGELYELLYKEDDPH